MYRNSNSKWLSLGGYHIILLSFLYVMQEVWLEKAKYLSYIFNSELASEHKAIAKGRIKLRIARGSTKKQGSTFISARSIVGADFDKLCPVPVYTFLRSHRKLEIILRTVTEQQRSCFSRKRASLSKGEIILFSLCMILQAEENF